MKLKNDLIDKFIDLRSSNATEIHTSIGNVLSSNTKKSLINAAFVESIGSFTRNDDLDDSTAFGFGTDSTYVVIACISIEYTKKYGRYFPILGLLNWKNYINRKKYNREAEEISESHEHIHTPWIDEYKKLICVSAFSCCIVYGSSYSLLNKEEYLFLYNLYLQNRQK